MEKTVRKERWMQLMKDRNNEENQGLNPLSPLGTAAILVGAGTGQKPSDLGAETISYKATVNSSSRRMMSNILEECRTLLRMQEDWSWAEVGAGDARTVVLMHQSPEYERHSTLINKLATLCDTLREPGRLEAIHVSQWYRDLPHDIGLEGKLAVLMYDSRFQRGTHIQRVAMLIHEAEILACEQGLTSEQIAKYRVKISEVNSLNLSDLYDQVIKALLEGNQWVRNDAATALKIACSKASVDRLLAEITKGNQAQTKDALQPVLRELNETLIRKLNVSIGIGNKDCGSAPVTQGWSIAEERPLKWWQFWKK